MVSKKWRTKKITLGFISLTLACVIINRNKISTDLLTNSIDKRSTFEHLYSYAPVADFTTTENHGRYVNMWEHRFSSSKARNKSGGYVFFKHIRKAGGSAIKEYLSHVFEYHENKRSCDELFQQDLSDEEYELYVNQIGDGPQKNLAIESRSRMNSTKNAQKSYKVHYIEQEFLPMDWKCPTVDPRWKDSLSIIVLRNPIERHMSEFFYKGPGGWAQGRRAFKIKKEKLFVDEAYSQALSEFIYNNLPAWIEKNGSGQNRKKQNDFKFFFRGEVYMDNYQLRSLAGCSSGECLKKIEMSKEKRKTIQEGYNNVLSSYSSPRSQCTKYFDVMCKPHFNKHICPNGYDGTCYYPTAAWDEMDESDLARGIKALEGFDVVLINEKLNDDDQVAFLADVMGVPRHSSFSVNQMSTEMMNAQVSKKSPREITHFYRDILSKFEILRNVTELIHDDNRLDLELFKHATKLNRRMIDQWKQETNWRGV